MTEEEKALLKEQQQEFRQQLELDWEDQKVYKRYYERYTEVNKQTDTSLDVKTPACRPKHMLGFLFYRLCS